jgi:DNA-binding NarL/FixJ family response regulator
MNIRTKILIIEKDQPLAKTIQNDLTLHGYNVCCTNNGSSGIQKAFEYRPDLILCTIKMNPIDGYKVYNIVKDSSLIDGIPFIFISSKSDLQEIRFGMDLGADDYLVKPFDNESLIHSIEIRLTKFKKLKEIGKHKFKTAFNFTPNGVFLFDGHVLSEANPCFMRIFNLGRDNITSYSIEDFLDSPSYQKIKDRIIRCKNGLLKTFSETVSLIPKQGEKFEATLYISVIGINSSYPLMVGLVTMNNNKSDENKVFMSDVLNVLKSENIVVAEPMRNKLIDLFKRPNFNRKTQDNHIFSYRENQVLSLSIEGLPVKIIADKLSISSRTVEKYRAKLMEKTNSNNMIKVIIFAFRNNLIAY